MRLSPLAKREVLGGVLLFAIIIFFTITYSFSEPITPPEEAKICLTEDILLNPILQDREIWKVNSKTVYSENQDISENPILAEKNEYLGFLLNNSFSETDSSVNLTLIESPILNTRPENLLVDIKSSREKTLLKAAGVKVSVHKVKSGESLWDISRMYGIDIETIIGANQQDTNINKLKVGQELNILSEKGVIHKVNPYETLSSISRLYGIATKEIMNFNDLKSSNLKIGQTLVIPEAIPLDLECRSGFSEGFIWPVRARISSVFGSRWGKMHNGIDLVVSTGTPVKAAKSGKIIFAATASGYGKAVYIQHDDKTVTRYGHNSKLLVKKNDYVYQGEIITLSGNTGVSTGPHLHFEIRINGKPQNPLNYLKK